MLQDIALIDTSKSILDMGIRGTNGSCYFERFV